METSIRIHMIKRLAGWIEILRIEGWTGVGFLDQLLTLPAF
jgi:hypothetical protein